MSIKTARIALITVLCTSGAASAAPGARTGGWQISLTPTFTNSNLIQFNGGAQADINEHSGFEFGFGYNFSDYMELDLEFGSATSNYTGTRVGDDGSTERFTSSLYRSHMNLGFTLNLLASRLTPFLKANLGMNFIDSGIPTGDFGSACWWDPWWGYVCGPYAQTYTSSEYSYGADVGLRYDITNSLFLKASMGKTYLNLDNADAPDFTRYKFTFGFMFR